MKQLLTILPILLSACAEYHLGCEEYWDCVDKTDEYEEARVAAVDAWELLIDHVSDSCYDWTERVRVVESEVVISFYGPDISGVVRSRVVDNELEMAEIYIKPSRTKEQKDCTVVHEFVHVLGACELYYTDSEHAKHELWATHGTDTVENVGCCRVIEGG